MGFEEKSATLARQLVLLRENQSPQQGTRDRIEMEKHHASCCSGEEEQKTMTISEKVAQVRETVAMRKQKAMKMARNRVATLTRILRVATQKGTNGVSMLMGMIKVMRRMKTSGKQTRMVRVTKRWRLMVKP